MKASILASDYKHHFDLWKIEGLRLPFLLVTARILLVFRAVRYNARSSFIHMFPQQASWWRCSGGCLSRGILRFTTSDLHRLISGTQLAGLPPQEPVAHLNARCAHARSTGHRSPVTDHPIRAGFTLLELLIVIGIIALLLVLIAPAFTTLKSAGDVTSAAYTIKGVLDTARTYAKANNTYTWVGFYEENTSAATPTNNTPPYPGKGRVLWPAWPPMTERRSTKIQIQRQHCPRAALQR